MNKEKIEELAFKDRKELANLNELDLLEIIEFLQLDRKQWINQYSAVHNDYVDLQQENQELKLELSGYRQAILEDKDMLGLKEKNQELKKHLELPEHCNLKTIEDYKSYYEDATKEEILKDTYIDYCAYVNLAHRYAELKKKLEEINKMIEKCGFVNIEQVMLNYCGLLTQQKEFINYLEDKIDICDGFLDTVKSDLQEIPYRVMSSKKTYITNRIKENEIAHKVYKEILSKYQEIIGNNEQD